MAVTKISDVVVPSIFGPYVQQQTEEKSELINAGIMVRDAEIDRLLAGGGLTFSVPSFKDVSNVDENVSTDDDTTNAVPQKTGTSKEVAVRLSRNQTWSTMDLAADLAGADPMASIASRVSGYWQKRLQAAMIAVVQGIFADNAASPSGTDTHVINDMTVNISGSSYVAGVTDFSAPAFLDAATTMGDSMQSLGMAAMHSIVYNRAQKNNLIDFIPDSEGRVTIPTFLGRRVIVDDGLPNPAGLTTNGSQTSAGIFHTWLFGTGAFRLGIGTPEVPVEVYRLPLAGNGGGQEILINRVMWCIHPVGHAYIGTAPNGGPTNASTTNNLSNAGSWSRVFPERKQIKIARLITRES